jgi:hypothetical protein
VRATLTCTKLHHQEKPIRSETEAIESHTVGMCEVTEDITFPLKILEDRIFYFLALMSRHTKRGDQCPVFEMSLETNIYTTF